MEIGQEVILNSVDGIIDAIELRDGIHYVNVLIPGVALYTGIEATEVTIK
jgi:hypothetical protein